MIAFTNHALDHMLRSVLDADITKNIVRLGSRSADERIAPFSLEQQESVAGRTRLSAAFSGHRRALRDVEDEIKAFMDDFFKTEVNSSDLIRYLSIQFPVLLESIENPPEWVQALHQFDVQEQDEWSVAGRNGKNVGEVDKSLYGFWLRGGDVKFLNDAHYSMRHRQEPEARPAAAARQVPANRFEILRSDVPEEQGVQAVDTGAPSDASIQHAEGSLEAEDDEDNDVVVLDASPEEEWLNDAILSDLDELSDIDEEELFLSPHPVPAPTHSPSPPPTLNERTPPETSPQTPLDAQPGNIRPDDFTNLKQFFIASGCSDIPSVPATSRPLHDLFEADEAWLMSSAERRQLHATWSDDVRVAAQDTQNLEFRRLREKHEHTAQEFLEGQAEVS